MAGGTRTHPGAVITIAALSALVLLFLWAAQPNSGQPTPPQSPALTTMPPAGTSAPPTSSPSGDEPATSPPSSHAPTTSQAPSPSPSHLATPSQPISPAVGDCRGAAWSSPRPGAAAVVAQLERRRGVQISVSWWQDGRVRSAGTLGTTPAWSTIKVPLAVANNDPSPAAARWRRLSLRDSDNTAADHLWRGLGTTEAARASALTTVLRRGGNPHTPVPSRQLFPPHSVAGQTLWSTAEQVGFLQQLRCLPRAGQVITEMSQPGPVQQWGLATRPGSVTKAGWGPTRNGRGFEVRQFGWFERDGARIPVAVAVRGESSTFASTRMILESVVDAL